MRARLLQTGRLPGLRRGRRRATSSLADAGLEERGARGPAVLTARERDEFLQQEEADAMTRLDHKVLDEMRLDRLRNWFKSATPSSAESARQYLRELYAIPGGLSEVSVGVALAWCNNAHCIQNYFFPVVFPQAGLVPGIRSYNILIRQLILEGRSDEAHRVHKASFPALAWFPMSIPISTCAWTFKRLPSSAALLCLADPSLKGRHCRSYASYLSMAFSKAME